MKIVVHMGLHKTGTTSLQTALFAARDGLRARGVLYPDGGVSRESHKLLTAMFKPADLVSTDLRRQFDFDAVRMRRAASAMWDSVRDDVERLRPALLILSSEYFGLHPRREDYDIFVGRLAELSADVEPVIYFRETASHFGSNAQQNVKNGRWVGPVEGAKLERDAGLVEAAFGRPIVACAADRDHLVDGDIVADFLARFVTPVVGPVDVAPVRLNESISAEAMAVLDRFRKLRYPEPTERLPDFHSLRAILAKLEAAEGRAPGARLRPEAAAGVRRSALDMIWLRDRHGIVFSGVDYDAIDGQAFEIDPLRTAIEDLFEVDVERRDRLQAAALAEALSAWREVERMPKLTRAVTAAGGALFARRGRKALLN
jgi:hypothetical protein